ncbi:ABC transporter substrate-binding protein [Cohnella silvisoli]|uniref:Sugar ABC transporter substrate-binding protein n=1 Tax=Cohnella silvisoli TaxID=2873699 RepID=A0ABV1KY46_9BACL|nr:sugar ABC transporter substrate-binding protein [Cohnella silvisoli]MCD9021918.1 sugar ABC transporter substrate-binding protein [Cohnella silvisoli]
MNKRMFGLLAISTALLVTSACSNGGSGGSGKKIEISFTDVAPSPERKKFFNEIIAEFEKENTNIKVKLETVPWDQAFAKLTAQGQSKTMPDVVNVYPSWLTTFVPAGYLEPITEQYDAWDKKDNLAAFVKNVTIEKQQREPFNDVYIIPDGLMGEALFIRTDWMKEANLELPKTWDELFNATEKLTDPAKNRYGFSYRGARSGFDQIFAYIFSVTKGESYEPDGTSVLLRPEALTAFKRYTDIYKKGWAPKDSINWGYQEMVQGFTSGVSGMLSQTTEVVATAQASMKDGTWTVIPTPPAADGNSYGGAGASWGYSISKNSKNKEAAWKFIEFISKPESNNKYSKVMTLIPIMQDSLKDPELGQGPMKGFIDMLNDPKRIPGADMGKFPELGEFRESIMDAEVQKYLLGTQSAEDTMKHLGDFLTKGMQKFMKENPDYKVPHAANYKG